MKKLLFSFVSIMVFGCLIFLFAKSKTESFSEKSTFFKAIETESLNSIQLITINEKDQECVHYADNVVNFFEHESSNLSSAELMEIHERAYNICVAQKN